MSNDVTTAALRVEIEALRLRIDGLEVRLEARIAAEEETRRAEIETLREEWRNLATAISANSTAVANVASKMAAEFETIKEAQKFQTDQLKLVGQAMELLLQAEGLEVPRGS